MKRWIVRCFLTAVFYSTSCLAAQTYMSIIGGQGIAPNAGKSQRFMVGESTYDYAVKHTVQVPDIIGASIGRELQFQRLRWQTGFAYYLCSSYTIKGTLTQGPDTFTSNQYNYQYNLLSRRLVWENKFLTTWHDHYHPYLSLNLGESFTNTSHYQTDAPFFLIFTPQFAAKTNKSFTYSIGLGLDIDILDHWRMGASYQFTDLGKANLGNGNIDVLSVPTLKQNHLYTQELLARLTWII